MPGKFEVGKSYFTTDWFCGDRIEYICTERKEHKVCLAEHLNNFDGEITHNPKEYDIFSDENGEYILLYEYKGYENRLYTERN